MLYLLCNALYIYILIFEEWRTCFSIEKIQEVYMNTSKKIITAVLASACLMGTVLLPAETIPFNNTTITVSAAPAAGRYRIICSALTIRKAASTSSAALGQIDKGSIVNVSSVTYRESCYWGKVYHRGVSGYIRMDSTFVEHV